jgi:hypothetical protein
MRVIDEDMLYLAGFLRVELIEPFSESICVALNLVKAFAAGYFFRFADELLPDRNKGLDLTRYGNSMMPSLIVSAQHLGVGRGFRGSNNGVEDPNNSTKKYCLRVYHTLVSVRNTLTTDP